MKQNRGSCFFLLSHCFLWLFDPFLKGLAVQMIIKQSLEEHRPFSSVWNSLSVFTTSQDLFEEPKSNMYLQNISQLCELQTERSRWLLLHSGSFMLYSAQNMYLVSLRFWMILWTPFRSSRRHLEYYLIMLSRSAFHSVLKAKEDKNVLHFSYWCEIWTVVSGHWITACSLFQKRNCAALFSA